MTAEKHKTAECVRRVGNWSKIEPKHRFDKKTYNKRDTRNDIPIASPKLEALFNKIKELDQKDLEKDGHVYKHMIYSDVKTLGHGAKIIASAFMARGFYHVYDKDFSVRQTVPKPYEYNSFAVLCSTPVYDKPITVKLKNAVLEAYNRRPENVHGKYVRFLILDQGYKEGIDVFDIKYIHLFEPAITAADEKQAIGRGTRMCGQQGLTFNNQNGWPLYVFRYNSLLPNDPFYKQIPTIHDLFLYLSGYDLRSLQFARELDKMCVLGAVDYDLTKTVHSFSITGKSSVFRFSKDVEQELMKDTQLSKKRAVEKIIMYGREYYKGEAIQCKAGCKGVIPIPTALMMIAWLVASNDKDPFHLRRPRSFLCKEITTNRAYCDVLNLAWHNPTEFVFNNSENIKRSIKSLKEGSDARFVYTEHIKDMLRYISPGMKDSIDNTPISDLSLDDISIAVPEHIPPHVKLSFRDMRRYILQQFGDYRWGNVGMENMCDTHVKGGSSIVKFTPTQNFLKDYFQPSNAYKGMLVYSSTGSGKSCLAIATASNSFERENYTILWVTRHTLKSDIWKNMFGQVCNLVLQEKMRDGLKIPNTLHDRKGLLPHNWIEPISYKQFSNFLQGKNKKLEKVILARNGKKDPLYKTLIIIDEAHKLYARDVIGSERPDVDVLRKMIHTSYSKSGKDSARILLMSATPYTSDPMDLIKLLNFLREDDDQLPEDFDTFSRRYLDNNGSFTKDGTIRFIQEITGYISYLNRENDIRQFAYPVLSDVMVPVSASMPTEPLEKRIETYTGILDTYTGILDEDIPETLRNLKDIRKEDKQKCMEIKAKDERPACKKQADTRYADERKKIDARIADIKKDKMSTKVKMRDAKKKLVEFVKNDISQETTLMRDCFKVTKNREVSSN